VLRISFQLYAAFSLTFSSAKIYQSLLVEQGCDLLSIFPTPPTSSLCSSTLPTYAASLQVFIFSPQFFIFFPECLYAVLAVLDLQKPN